MHADRSIPVLDMQSPDYRADPYPTLAWLRRTAPVARVDSPLFGRAYLLTRYEDVRAALEDPRLASDRRSVAGVPRPFPWWFPRSLDRFEQSMVTADDPDHARLRGLVHKAFTRKRVQELSLLVEETVGRLLDAAEAKPSCDLIADFAAPLPVTIISEMMGVPEAERRAFQRWTGAFLESLGRGTFIGALPAFLSMSRLFRRLVRLRREQPGEDFITALVKAEEDGQRLDEQELIAMIFLLLVAGHETTVNLIGSGILALLERPEQLARLRAEPELIGSAVEELLRFTNPVEHPGPRFAREDLELHGHVIPRGSPVLLMLASANRDETVFPAPDELDLGRTPNRHLAFGQGCHYCLGAPLARLEGASAIGAFVRRFAEVELAVPKEALRWQSKLAVRGLATLPVRLRSGACRGAA